MAGIISNDEAQRLLATRLERYRLAVQNGFYNDYPGTITYRGYQIVRDGDTFIVIKGAERLMQFQHVLAAKRWIGARLNAAQFES